MLDTRLASRLQSPNVTDTRGRSRRWMNSQASNACDGRSASESRVDDDGSGDDQYRCGDRHLPTDGWATAM
jgi:hypothetical protein